MMHGRKNIKLINAEQAKPVHQYKYMFILKCALKLVLKISYTMMHGRKNIKGCILVRHFSITPFVATDFITEGR